MNREETANCIKHHLTVAGRQDTLFSDDAVELIATRAVSRAVPLTRGARCRAGNRVR